MSESEQSLSILEGGLEIEVANDGGSSRIGILRDTQTGEGLTIYFQEVPDTIALLRAFERKADPIQGG